MRKIFIIAAAAGLAAGCAWLKQDAAEVWNNTAGPIVAQTGQTQDGVQLTAQKPSAACTFKGGILGDSNPDEAGLPSSILNISERIRSALVSNAKHMGGNTVWLRTTAWQNPDISTDYYAPFFVNNVEYSALVYDCPEK